MTIKTISFLLCCCSYLFSSLSLAGGASVIGNGAGIVENNIQFSYSSLPDLVKECLRTNRCEISATEARTLSRILTVLSINASNADRILFVSEKENPGFFDTGVNEKHRIAKTGLTPKDPIYINTDLLYNEKGQPNIDLPTITSILLHEVGHQSGEQSHAILDIIGSKLKKMISHKMDIHSIVLSDDSYLEVTIINHKFPFLISDLMVSWQGIGTKNLSQAINTSIKCTEGDLSGLEVFNGHFTSISISDIDKKVGFGIWINLSCYSEAQNKNLVETKSMELEIGKDLSVKILNFSDL